MPSWYKLSKIYVGQDLVRPSSRNFPYEKNAYTELYLPLVDDAEDYGGKNHATVNNGVTFTTVGSTPCALFSSDSIQVVDTTGLRWANGYTWCLWWKYSGSRSTASDMISLWWDNSANSVLIRTLNNKFQCWLNPNASWFGNQVEVTSSIANDTSSRHNLVLTYYNNTNYLYVDKTLFGSKTASSASTYNNTDAMRIWCFYSPGTYNFNWNLSNIILESRQWSASDISTYYDNTKSYFGL